jgi:phosphinothricin acetyltransferase
VAEVSIYIGEKYRGQKMGKPLLEALIEASEGAGYWTLQAGIFEENAASVALHHKCGFRTVGIRERIGRDNSGKWRSTLLLERRSNKTGLD